MINNSVTIDINKISQSKEWKQKRFDMIDNLYKKANENRIDFWNEQAEHLSWQTKWQTTMEWKASIF